MAYTAQQLEELEKLIAGGIASAAEQDRRVTYRTQEELQALATEMRRQIDPANAPKRLRPAVYDKGL